MSPRDAAAEVLALLLPAWPGAAGERSPPPATALEGASLPADQRLREYFRRHPSLGKRDRLQIGNWVFDVLRNLRLYQELARSQGPQAAEDPIAALIDISRAANARSPPDPASPISPAMPPAIPSAIPPAMPSAIPSTMRPAIRYSLPDWLWESLLAAHGTRAEAIAAALLQPSPVDLRANLLVGKAQALRQMLAQRGVESALIPDVPTGLRLVGRPDLEHLDLFAQGWFEIQDAGSQRIADACGARRGGLVIDFCAGAGGKALAIAARMRNLGKVLAFDTSDERLSRLMPRAKRARATIIEPMRIDGLADSRLGRYRRRADVVLVDAPCSGTGTLRRSPDLKWRLSPAQVLAYARAQAAILAAASELVKPGGALVYATCSLLAEENAQQVDAFDRAAGTSGFELDRLDSWLADEGPSSSFFVAKWGLQARN